VRDPVAGADGPVWHAELLHDPPAENRPHPFSRIDHTFGTLDAVVMWLGGAPIMDTSKASARMRKGPTFQPGQFACLEGSKP